MKSVVGLWAFLLRQPNQRDNVTRLVRLLAVLAAMVVVYSVGFHLLMMREGRDPSWFTGVYWTLTVMSTLGFGDITFSTDLGRVFTVVVLLSGIVMLMIVLPFAFIRFLYAPWLEAQLRLRAPRAVAAEVRDHVVICRWEPVARNLVRRLAAAGVGHCVLESDPAVAAQLNADGVNAIVGDPEAAETWRAVKVTAARSVFANLGDAPNTNVVLTVRDLSDVPVIATVAEDDSIDILELAGASHALPIKRRLGERLAAWIATAHDGVTILGDLGDRAVALVLPNEPAWVGQPLSAVELPSDLTVAGVWEHGRGFSIAANPSLTRASELVVIGARPLLERFAAPVAAEPEDVAPTVVIGGGRVGAAVIDTLDRQQVPWVLVERAEPVVAKLRRGAARVVVGDAADREVLTAAGIDRARSVIITTHDDSNNIYLSIYCRRLNPGLRLAARVTEPRNVEALYRAGADFVVDEAGLGASILGGLLLPEAGGDLPAAVALRRQAVPAAWIGRTLSEVDREPAALVVGYEVDGRAAIATGQTRLAVEHTLLVVARADAGAA